MGDVEVSRTGPDLADGGYTWTITFLRDTSETNTRCVETIGCPAAGNVPDLAADITAIIGSNKAVAHDEVVRGNLLRGDWTLSIDGGTTTAGPVTWDVSAADLDTALEAGLGNGVAHVEVSRTQQAHYGAFTWVITFTEDVDNIPTGAGDQNDFTLGLGSIVEEGVGCGADCMLAASSAMFDVTETVHGSTELGGTFTLNVDSEVARPFTIDFDETAADMENILETGLMGSYNLHVTLAEYGEGWGAVHVPHDGATHYGGQRWTVTFVDQPGDVDMSTSPPGSGDADRIDADHMMMTGDTAEITIMTPVGGSTPLGGTFDVDVGGALATGLSFKATDVDVKSQLDALATVDVELGQKEDELEGLEMMN